MGSEHHRHTGLAAEHEAVLRGLIHDLVHRQSGKVDVHELDDGTKPGQGRADRGANDPDLADRRLPNSGRSECIEKTGSDLERAAVLGDVLADHDDPRIPLHLETEGVAERLVVEHLARSRTWLGVGDRDLCPHAGKPACFSA